MDNPGKRLVILGHEEVDALYGSPRFTQEERDDYFTLSAPSWTMSAPTALPPSRLAKLLPKCPRRQTDAEIGVFARKRALAGVPDNVYKTLISWA